MEEQKENQSHRVVLEQRQGGKILGVIDVHSFDEKELIILTKEGKLLIKGNQLHVQNLNLQIGEMEFEGKIDALTYVGKSFEKEDKKIWKRIFQ